MTAFENFLNGGSILPFCKGEAKRGGAAQNFVRQTLLDKSLIQNEGFVHEGHRLEEPGGRLQRVYLKMLKDKMSYFVVC